MSNTATMSNSAKDLREASKAAAAGVKDFQEDFEALREDVARLTELISDLLAAKGNVAWRKAKSSVNDVVSGVEAKGQEAVDAAREVGGNVADVIDDSIKTRPYTTLALAIGVGILFGATWRR